MGNKFPINSSFTLENFTIISFEIVFDNETVGRMSIESQNPLSADDFYFVWKNYSPPNVIFNLWKTNICGSEG